MRRLRRVGHDVY